MSVTNHKVAPGQDLDLAMIEGTKIEVMCGLTFAPTVTVGTSGRADVPGAPDCENCQTLYDVTMQWNRLRHERNRINRELHAIEKEHIRLRRLARENRKTNEQTEVLV